MDKQINFIRQQGFATPNRETCSVQYRGLQFQPRLIGVLMVAGLILRSPVLFAVLSVALGWSAWMPTQSPFDLAYNRLVARRRGLPLLSPAPAPRRFAQALAATLMAIIAVALLTGHKLVAAGTAAVLLSAIAAIVFGGFCFGSFVFHLLIGKAAFARRTLPWASGKL